MKGWMAAVTVVAVVGACADDGPGGSPAEGADAEQQVGADTMDTGATTDASADTGEGADGGDSASPADAGDAGPGAQDTEADSGAPDASAHDAAETRADAADARAPACTPGATRCAAGASTVERCDAAGAGWVVSEACAEACAAGECVALVCTPNQKLCDGDTLRVCNPGGTATTTVMTCAAGCEESATGAACLLCEAGAKGCKDAVTAWSCVHPTEPPEETPCAPGLEACVAGGCTGLLAWTPGDTAVDAMLWLAIHTGACALDGASGGADLLCWALDTTKLKAPITAAGFSEWLCDGAAAGTLTAGDFLPVGAHGEDQIFAAALAAAGCAAPATLGLPPAGLQPGHPVGDLCESWHKATGKVIVGACP
ncbi:MAG: hypothetical protein AMXMBFR64_20790 [Myxococcales bacterium]